MRHRKGFCEDSGYFDGKEIKQDILRDIKTKLRETETKQNILKEKR
jgi:hypothetical protein